MLDSARVDQQTKKEDRMNDTFRPLLSFQHNLRLPLLCVAVFVLAGCRATATTATLQSVDAMLNSGQQEHFVALNELIVINADAELPQWNVSLGRRDAEFAEIRYFENRIQNTFLFSRKGNYTVKLGSHRSAGAGATMMHELTVVVQ